MDNEKLQTQQCRACYNATKGLKLLTNLTKYGGTQKNKSYADLLTEVSNINIMDDNYQELPKFICDNCSRKLKAAHSFLQQTLEVNKRLSIILMREKRNIKHQLDSLEEVPVDIQSCLEIKMENDETALENVTSERCQVEFKLEETQELDAIDNLAGKLDCRNVGEEYDTLNKLNENETSNNDFLSLDANNMDIQTTTNIKSLQDDKENINHDNNNKDSGDDKFEGYNSSSDEMESNKEHEQNISSNKEAERKITKKCMKSAEKVEKSSEDDIAVTCTQCNKIFNNSKALARHQRTSHIPEDQKCTCTLCFRKFSRSCSMYTHMRRFHGRDTVPLIRKPSTQERSFQCDKCPRNYTKKKHLNVHIKNKHSQKNESIDDKAENAIKGSIMNTDGTSAKSNKPKRYEVRSLCSTCGSSFSNKTHLKVHMRRHTGERPFKCDLCDRAYPRISELTCHRRIHTGEKPFACKICGKTFRVSGKMTTHMRSHTDIRPYKCTQCERSFKYSKDLSIHFRIHTGERPYRCNVCGSTFTQSNSLKTHRLKLGHMDNVVENLNN